MNRDSKDSEIQRIILIMGASGVGKDTLLRCAKEQVDAHFVQRYITRKPNNHEDNQYISNTEFAAMQARGEFISDWQAYGYYYGIRAADIIPGCNIISISRGVITDFEQLYPLVVAIEVVADRACRIQRLAKRNREANVSHRLSRTYPKLTAHNLIQFDNSAPLSETVPKFINVLNGL